MHSAAASMLPAMAVGMEGGSALHTWSAVTPSANAARLVRTPQSAACIAPA
jgi:hypothetical protein